MEENTKVLKKSFFKKVWYSIFKLEKYGELSAEGFGRAMNYLLKLSFIIAIIIGCLVIFQITQKVQKAVDFLNDQIGEFSYNEGILEITKEQPIKAPSSTFGEVIVDTSVETEEQLNQYLNSLGNDKALLLLKDKVVVKGLLSDETINYKYSSLLKELNINQIDKQGVINYITGNEIWNIYLQVFLVICIYSFLNTFVPILINAFGLSIFGWIATWLAKMKMRYIAVFNLAIYSLTLSIIIQVAYMIVNVLTGITMTYFQVMYIAVAAIYLIAAIFLIKSEFMKLQLQRIKEHEEQSNKIKESEPEVDEKEEKKKNEKENDKNEKEDNKKDDVGGKEEKETGTATGGAEV